VFRETALWQAARFKGTAGHNQEATLLLHVRLAEKPARMLLTEEMRQFSVFCHAGNRYDMMHMLYF
jgi:hypothetical protein